MLGVRHRKGERMSNFKATLTVDVRVKSASYDPMIFGGFLEHFGRQIYSGVFDPGSHLSDEKGFRQDAIAALRELKVPIVRWPGGCYVSGYHWEDGVGPTRTPTDDMAWGVVEPHTFGTDEFIELCHRLDWEPYICNNAGNGTVAEMVGWVEYCNDTEGKYAQLRKVNGHEAPHNAKFWSIGNENWGAHEIGHKSIEQWAPLVFSAAKAMKAADPTIRLSAASLPTREWMLPMLDVAGQYLDYISVHHYWLGLWAENSTPGYLDCIMKSQLPEALIDDAVDVLQASGHRGRIKIAFDEWNLRGWHHPGFPRKEVQDYSDPEVIALVAAREKNEIASQYTMADALFTASFFNACLRHANDVGMANIAPLVNTRGPLHVHSEGIVKRAHFHTFAMYANLLDKQVLDSFVEAVPLVHRDESIDVVDALVTADDAGKNYSIAIINRHPSDDVRCQIFLQGLLPHGSFEATVLSGDSVDSYNDIMRPSRVMPEKKQVTFEQGILTLQPHSLTIVKVGQNTRM